MQIDNLGVGLHPPLRMLWRGAVPLASAQGSGNTIYGVTRDGKLGACKVSDGQARWLTASGIGPRFAVSGTTIIAVRDSSEVIRLNDQGATFQETTLYAWAKQSPSPHVSAPVILGRIIHLAVGNRLMAVDIDGGLLYERTMTHQQPYTLMAYENDLVAIAGTGTPSRLRPSSSGYSVQWSAPERTQTSRECTAVFAGSRLITPLESGLQAFNVNTGARLWSRPNGGNLAMAAAGDLVYTVGDQGALWSINTVDGSVNWDRKYLAFVSSTPSAGLVVGQSHLWVGVVLADGSEPAATWAVNRSDGSFAWQATGVQLSYGNGLPLLFDGRLYTYGTSELLTAMQDLAQSPAVPRSSLIQSPNPLRGPMNDFNPVEVVITLGVPAKVSFIAWHERDVRNNAVGPIAYQSGSHRINYDARFPRGWTDINQFGRLAVDIEESNSGLKYTHVLLVPVNTLPDIHHHWARSSIEIMLYHKYIGGYPDLTFRPNNLVTRAETSTIIAKTLGREAPSAAFRTKFTDIDTHWARNHIMALEEQGIINGFQEPDGTFTFRPSLNMTRGQEARILVQAYEIAKASPSFVTRFIDISNHWAVEDIKALESAGYITGFQEPNGRFTYRPEQFLTRAELSTVVVRIRKLTRG